MLKESPSLRIPIAGHTDSMGDAKQNKVLGEERATAVFNAIAQQGIEAKRLTGVG